VISAPNYDLIVVGSEIITRHVDDWQLLLVVVETVRAANIYFVYTFSLIHHQT
jgi:hypothetical protein